MGYIDDCCGFCSRHKYCWKTFLTALHLLVVMFCLSSLSGRGSITRDCNPNLFYATTLLSFYFGFCAVRYIVFMCFQFAGHCESESGSKDYYGDIGSIEKRAVWHISFSYVDTLILTPLVLWTQDVNENVDSLDCYHQEDLVQDWSKATSVLIVWGYIVMSCAYLICVPSSIGIIALVLKSLCKRKKSKKVLYADDPHQEALDRLSMRLSNAQ